MSRALNGIKSGLVSGIVYGILDSVFTIMLVLNFRGQVMASLASYISLNPSVFANVTASDLFNLSLAVIPLISMIGGVLLGIVIGAVFGYAYRRIPGKAPWLKGLVFGLVIWAILNVLIGLIDVSEFGLYYYLSNIAGGLASALSYGYILGGLFGYLERRAGRALNS